MMQDALQQRIHDGDRNAFREVYGRYSREVYTLTQTALGDASRARAVVKQVFLRLYRELMHSNTDLDLPARLSALTNEEVRIVRIAMGDLSPDALQVGCSLTVDPVADPMTRVRMRMAQQSASSGPEAARSAVSAAAAAAAMTCGMTDAEETFSASLPAGNAAAHVRRVRAAGRPARGPARCDAPCAVPAEPVCTAAFSDEALPDTAPDPVPISSSEDAWKEASSASDCAPAEESPAPYNDGNAVESAPAPATAHTNRKKKQRRISGGMIFLTVFLSLLLLFFIWLLLGILMDLSLIGFVDLGYGWFNSNVFQFFQTVGGAA